MCVLVASATNSKVDELWALLILEAMSSLIFLDYLVTLVHKPNFLRKMRILCKKGSHCDTEVGVRGRTSSFVSVENVGAIFGEN